MKISFKRDKYLDKIVKFLAFIIDTVIQLMDGFKCINFVKKNLQ